MKIDLCKLLGVEEGEEFKIEYNDGIKDVLIFKIIQNNLYSRLSKDNTYSLSRLEINIIKQIKNIIKLPKKKEFTDDELCILRNIDKEYKWITKDRDGDLWIYTNKPKKEYDRYWKDCSSFKSLSFEPLDIFKNSLFTEIEWEDEEPIYIDEYVDRK